MPPFDDPTPGPDRWSDEPEPALPDTPMWLSHHWPHAYDRCAVVGGLHVCRRCLVLYPLALVSGIAISIGSWWPHGIDAWVLWLFPLPGVVEFVLDNLGRIGYSPRRQVVLSAGSRPRSSQRFITRTTMTQYRAAANTSWAVVSTGSRPATSK